MSSIKRSLFASTMLFAVAAATAASAQTAPPSQPTTPPTTAPPSTTPPNSGAAASSAEVVVTGSRIRRTTYNSPSPVQIITNSDARLEGLIDATSVLQGSTAAAGYSQVNNQFGGYVVNGGPGVNTLSLRGLGGQRTLILLNGRRLNPAGVSGTVADVDLNVIPDALVERYEVLKDGASSVYGSDAIGGVVNIITRNKFDGLNLEATDSVPQTGAGKQYELSMSAGLVRDSYHILFGAQYYQEDALRIRDMPGGACPLELQRLPTGGPYNFGRSYADGSPYCANTQTNNVTDFDTGLTWVYDPTQGAAFPYAPFHQNSFGAVPRITNIATDPRTADVDAASPSRRLAFTVIGGVDLPHNTELYFEGLGTNRRSQQAAFLPELFPSSFDDAEAVSTNPFSPFGGDLVQPILTMPVTMQTQDVWAGRALVGLRGDLGFLKGWKWDTSLTYGFNRANYSTDTVLTDKFENAINVVQAPVGTNPALVRVSPVDGLSYTCAVNVTNPAEKCYPLNMFESSAALTTDPALAYIRTKDFGHTNYDQVVFDATLDGPLFNLPAGPLQGVIGLEYRYDQLNDYPGKYAVAQDYFGLSSAGVTKGDDAVVDLYLEAEAPILKGLPLIDSLTLNASTRYTNYRTGGDQLTYKFNINWQMIPSLRLRATYGTSFRGPALYENYLAAQTSFTEVQDPCAMYGQNAAQGSNLFKNCKSEGLDPAFVGYSSTPEVFTQGAQGRLKSETSKNLTVGPVWQPSFADLQVSLSYFRIEIDNEISTLGAANILNLCYESSQFRNGSPYCALISARDSNNNIALIDDSYLNVSKQIVSGIDLDVTYRHKFNYGDLTLDGHATYAIEDSQELFPGSGVTNFTGTFGEPRWNANWQIRFKHHDWLVAWTTNYLGEQNEYPLTGETPGGRYNQIQNQQFYHSLSVEYEADKWRATLGVRNVFNDYPPVISNSADTAYAPRVGEFGNGYGNLQLYGRTIFVQVSKDF